MKGFPNFGNTCYFNSALQCLLYVPQLTNYFLSSTPLITSDFSQEYQKLVYQMWREGDPDPRELLHLVTIRFPQFSQGQQDAQELFLCLLEMFDNQNYINAIFKGRLVQETKCPSGSSIKFEDFTSLVLYPSKEMTVIECLEESQKYQNIHGYTDNKGTTHSIGLSQTKFWMVPRVLVICFQGRKKITIDEEIDMRPFIHRDSPTNSIKKLMGLIYHHGSQDFGHYIAFVKHGGTWYYKDDLNVREVSPPKEATYYMAFYN